MPYIKTNWQEGQTALGPVNLNKIEQGIADAMAAAEAPLLQLVATIPGMTNIGDILLTDDDTLYFQSGTTLNRIQLSTGQRTILAAHTLGGVGTLVQIDADTLAALRPDTASATVKVATYSISGNAWTTREASGQFGSGNPSNANWCGAMMRDGKVSMLIRGKRVNPAVEYGNLMRWNPVGYVWDAPAVCTTTGVGYFLGMAHALTSDTLYVGGYNSDSSVYATFRAVNGAITDVHLSISNTPDGAEYAAADGDGGRVFNTAGRYGYLNSICQLTAWNSTTKARKVTAVPRGRLRYFNNALYIVDDQYTDTNIYKLPTGGL